MKWLNPEIICNFDITVTHQSNIKKIKRLVFENFVTLVDNDQDIKAIDQMIKSIATSHYPKIGINPSVSGIQITIKFLSTKRRVKDDALKMNKFLEELAIEHDDIELVLGEEKEEEEVA